MFHFPSGMYQFRNHVLFYGLLSQFDHIMLHAGPFATVKSSIFWTQTLVNGTFYVHFGSRSAGREHADSRYTPTPPHPPPPTSRLQRENGWLIWRGTSPWACHNEKQVYFCKPVQTECPYRQGTGYFTMTVIFSVTCWQQRGERKREQREEEEKNVSQSCRWCLGQYVFPFLRS